LTEVFYWPVGAAAYLLTLSSTLVLFWQVVHGRIEMPHGRKICFTALLVAACSSEVGAIFVVCYAGMRGAASALGKKHRRGRHQISDSILWCSIPALVSVSVLVVLFLNRFHLNEPMSTVVNSAYGHPLASVAAAIRELGRELLGLSPSSQTFQIAPKLASELLFCVGVGLSWPVRRASKSVPHEICVLIAAFLTASMVSLTTSYLHFGTAGGQRHELLRHCWILMSCGGAGVLLAPTLSRRVFRSPVILRLAAHVLLFMSVASLWHIKELMREYNAYPIVVRSIRENFRSGFASGNHMIYVLPPHRGVLAFAQIEPGTYIRNAGTPVFPGYILKYFDKRTLIVQLPPPH
jgi:hypothetical protein